MINKNLTKIISVFLLLSPIIDVLTSFTLQYSFSLGTITRGLFLVFIIYYFIFSYKPNKKEFFYLIIIFSYLILFLLTMININGNNVFTYELTMSIKTFYYPILLFTIYKINNKQKLELNPKIFIIVLSCYLLLIFIPNILNLGFNSYFDSKIGSIGWFTTANEIGGIISLLAPILISYLLQEKKLIYGLITILLLYVSFTIGTKVTILSLAIILTINLIIVIIKLIKQKKYLICGVVASSISVIALVGACYYIPKTSFYKNIKIHLDYLQVENIQQVFSDLGLIDHFVFSSRIKFLHQTKTTFYKSKLTEKILGIGYIEKESTDHSSIKLIEMDYYDILYRHGFIGTTIYFSFFIIILYKLLITILTNIKHLNYLHQNLIISLFLSIFLALFTGHIYTAPSVSLIAILILITLTNQLEVITHES